MPTVLRIGGLRVAIFPNDHQPPHVHVQGAGKQAVFNLGCPLGPPTLRDNYGFTTGDLNRIEAALTDAMSAPCSEWERIHGDH